MVATYCWIVHDSLNWTLEKVGRINFISDPFTVDEEKLGKFQFSRSNNGNKKEFPPIIMRCKNSMQIAAMKHFS